MAVVIIIFISILVLVRIYITNKINNKRIKELEHRIDKYYKRKENQSIKPYRDIEE